MKSEVSVVIPVFNGEGFIARGIQSVLNQTVQPEEIIVVNDGSTDKTAERLMEFGDEIKVITIENSGVANARNVGILAAKKEYIAFLDADDVWHEDKLKIQLSYLERFPNVGFCCSDFYFVSQNSDSKSNLFQKFANNDDYNFDEPLKTSPFLRLLETNFVGSCSNVVFKRSLIEETGLIDESLKQAEDFDLWIRFSLITDFILISKPLVEKYTHDSNLTNNFLETLEFREIVLMKLPKNDFTRNRLIPHLDKYYLELARCRYRISSLSFKTNFKWKAIKYLLKIFTTMPLSHILRPLHSNKS